MSKKRALLWAAMGAGAAAAFFLLAYPLVVIQPFRPQGASELAAALAVRRWAPAGATVLALLAIGLTIALWKGSRWWARTLAVLGTAATGLFAALTYVNVFEMMFHRIDAPQTLSASEARLDNDDMVLAIQADGHARAYPIRMMGYHHIANDWLGRVAVVATY
jgi:hypothetical protein